MRTLNVEDLMSTALLTVRPNDKIDSADLDMKLAGIRHFPVVDDRNHLLGVVSDRDLLRSIGGPKGGSVVISEIMTTDIETVQSGTSAAEAVELMLERKIGCLPVTGDDGHLVGMITETDFLQVAHKALTDDDLSR